MNKNLQQVMLVAVLTLLSVGAAIGLRAWLHPPLNLQATELLAEPIPLQDQHYTLTFDKIIFNLDTAREHWVLLYPGNTACTQQYTQTLEELGKVLADFEGVDTQYKPLVVFIDLYPDPRKTIELTTYVSQLHKDLQIASNSGAELLRWAKALGFSYEQGSVASCPANDSARIFILDPQLRYIGFIAAPHHAKLITADMQKLSQQLWRYHIQR